MKELFNDKSDEIINYLWSQIEKIYGPSQGSNDLLDEIYNEKNENAAKKFPSKIVNPNVDNNKPVKPLFTSAVERVRDERRRESGRDYRESGRYNKYDRDYRGDYRNRRDYYDGRRDRQGGDSRTMNVGSKKIVLKSKVSRSRSGSKEKERERSREREGDLQTEQDYPPYRGEQYYPPYRGGYFNMRRFPRGGGRFMRFMQPRFIDSRR